MNILIPVKIWKKSGGLETVNYDIVRALIELCHAVTVVSVFGTQDDPPYPGSKLISLSPKNRLLRSLWFRWLWQPSLSRIINKNQNVSNLCIFGHVHLLEAIKSNREPFLKSYAWIYGIDVWGEPGKKWIPYLMRMKKVISISRFTLDAMDDNQISEKSVVIPCCIDVSRFSPAPDSSRIRRNEILICGRLESANRSKGHDMLFKALPLVESKLNQPCAIRVVGRGSDQERLMKLAHSLGISDRVIFTGRLSDDELLEAYQHCGVFCMPTPLTKRDKGYWNGEGFGIVYIEAAACSRPVIASREGGAPETIRPGETGLLVDPNSVESISEAIVSILSNPGVADDMGRAGRMDVLTRFSYDSFRENIQHLLEQS